MIWLPGCTLPDMPSLLAYLVTPQLTENSGEVVAEPIPEFSATPKPTVGEIVNQTATPTVIPEFCNLVAPGNPIDLSIPDGSEMRQGETFSKTWRFINAGSCPWTKEYAIVWFSGSEMGMNRTQYLGSDVLPGDSIDISVNMTAPPDGGMFRSNWMFKSPEGELFGIGPDGKAPFWVEIIVPELETPTLDQFPTLTPTAVVYAKGEVELVDGDALNLDSVTSIEEDEIDLTFMSNEDALLQIKPENGAGGAVFGMNLPAQSDCQNLGLGQDAILLEGLMDGIYICYETNKGLPGFARLTRIDLVNQTLNIEYLTWAIP